MLATTRWELKRIEKCSTSLSAVLELLPLECKRFVEKLACNRGGRERCDCVSDVILPDTASLGRMVLVELDVT